MEIKLSLFEKVIINKLAPELEERKEERKSRKWSSFLSKSQASNTLNIEEDLNLNDRNMLKNGSM